MLHVVHIATHLIRAEYLRQLFRSLLHLQPVIISSYTPITRRAILEEVSLWAAHCACTVALVLVEGITALVQRINLCACQSRERSRNEWGSKERSEQSLGRMLLEDLPDMLVQGHVPLSCILLRCSCSSVYNLQGLAIHLRLYRDTHFESHKLEGGMVGLSSGPCLALPTEI
jgi:hypothetical protein